MGKEKKTGLAGGSRGAAASSGDGRNRPKRPSKPAIDTRAPLPPGLVAKKPVPTIKHHTYFEFVENTDKKKKLEFKVTADQRPPPGFEFVPIGNPELTTLCKDISREIGAMIFMVSTSHEDKGVLALQMNRVGHHIRSSVIEQARQRLGDSIPAAPIRARRHHRPTSAPEPIPATQEEINAQADAALRDLFPRIPHTDRQMIIDHAFRKGATFNGEPVVGLSANLPLYRRVQLAVLAHIRHAHTRYDSLLKETTWQNSRRAVEALCLDILVKWRGDEENGRDDLEEILREVVVISDSEDDDTDSSDDESDDDAPVVIGTPPVDKAATPAAAAVQVATATAQPDGKELPSKPQPAPQPEPQSQLAKSKKKTPTRGHAASANRIKGKNRRRERAAEKKKSNRGFKRYQAAWDQAVDRNRREDNSGSNPAPVHMTRSVSHGSFLHPSAGPSTQPAASLAGGGDLSDSTAFQTHARPFMDDYHLDLARSRQHVAPAFGNQGGSPTNAWFPPRDQAVVDRDGRDVAASVPAPTTARPLYPDLPIQSIEGSSSRDKPVTTLTKPVFVRTLHPRKRERDESPTQQPIPIHRAYPLPAVGEDSFKRQRVRLDDGPQPAFSRDAYDLQMLQPSLPTSYHDPQPPLSQVQVFRPISHPRPRQDFPRDPRRLQPSGDDVPPSTWDNPILIGSSPPSSAGTFVVVRPNQELHGGYEPNPAPVIHNHRYALRSSRPQPDYYRRNTYASDERGAGEPLESLRVQEREMYYARDGSRNQEMRPTNPSRHKTRQAEPPQVPFYVRSANVLDSGPAYSHQPPVTQDMAPFYVRSGTHAPSRQPPDSRVYYDETVRAGGVRTRRHPRRPLEPAEFGNPNTRPQLGQPHSDLIILD